MCSQPCLMMEYALARHKEFETHPHPMPPVGRFNLLGAAWVKRLSTSLGNALISTGEKLKARHTLATPYL